MTLPAISNNLIDDVDFNTIHNDLDAVLGLELGDTDPTKGGYGLPTFYSTPVTTSDRVSVFQWNNAINDVDIIHTHITGNTYTGATLVTSSTVIEPTLANTLDSDIEYLMDPVRRWTCHPTQFYSTATVSHPVGTSTFWTTSTRVAPWGNLGTESTPQLTHEVVVSWPNKAQTYYYFNQGAYLTWKPYYQGLTSAGTSLDTVWARFLDHVNTTTNFIYDRNTLINWPGGTSTVYESSTMINSGSLYINVIAVPAFTATSQVTFTILYGNSDSSDLIVSPSVQTWSYTV
jgi:hypothetical protein